MPGTYVKNRLALLWSSIEWLEAANMITTRRSSREGPPGAQIVVVSGCVDRC
ncbi:hypothetical protein [Nocardia amamiensis]|uniref:hypothetical protein n=1 Tax=Nocardia amamiensis TaxID=404578 RepID=UPI0012F5054E|nr:hypothetical protein [Nocardia amamiensis]